MAIATAGLMENEFIVNVSIAGAEQSVENPEAWGEFGTEPFCVMILVRKVAHGER